MTKFSLTVTLFFTRGGLWRAELIADESCEPITEWLPTRDQAEAEARHWFNRTLGPGHEISFQVMRDLRHQD